MSAILSPTRMQTCPACDGYPIYRDGSVCEDCTGSGVVPAIDESPPVSLNHGGPGICTLCHPYGASKLLQPEQGSLL